MNKIEIKAALKIVRGAFLKRLDTGVTCPCCKRFARIYYRDIHSTMAKSIVSLYVLQKDNPTRADFHIKEISKVTRFFHNASDVGKLAAWDIVKKGEATGTWAISKKGLDWVEGKITVPKSVIMYEGEVLGFKGDSVQVEDCLKEKFDIATVYP